MALDFHFRRWFLLIAAPLALPTVLYAGPPRQQISMDAGWRFHLDRPAALASAVPVPTWQWIADARGAADAPRMTAPGLDDHAPGWQTARTGEDVFHGRRGFAWFRTVLPPVAGPGRTLHFERVDDNAVVYLNGIRLLSHTGFNDSFDVPLDSAWKSRGPNGLAILVQNLAGSGGITRPASVGRLASLKNSDPSKPGYHDASWTGVHLPDDYVIRQRYTHAAPAGHGSLPTPPAWYRKTFLVPAGDKGKTLWL
ncbi:MAG: beta-galactosidase, partial [Chloroflexi bacterium]|nr:beta-galactosidase [Chloroflexota bacterium]